jgi:hypothetical protein
MTTIFRGLNILALLILAYFLYDLWQKSKAIENEQIIQKGFTAQQNMPDYQNILDRLQILENKRITFPTYSDLESRLKTVEEIIEQCFEEI